VTLDEKRAIVEGIARKLLGAIGKDTLDWLKDQGFGVTLFAFTFEPGAIAYISTSEREDMIRTLKEFLAYQEAGLTTEARGERGLG
jgi:hypothetical protein